MINITNDNLYKKVVQIKKPIYIKDQKVVSKAFTTILDIHN